MRQAIDGSRHARALAACLCVLVLASSCARSARPRGGRVPVSVAQAVERAMPFELIATGTVEPIESADVSAQATGTVTRVAFREGADVVRGQLLVQLDPRPFRAAVAQAEAALARSRAQATNAIADAARAERLFQQNVVSQAEWDQKRASAEAASSSAAADSAAVATARLNLQYASIRAPITGRSGQLRVHVGDLVRASATEPLVSIHQLHPVLVRFTVPESDVPLVQRHRTPGTKVRVRASTPDSTDLVGRLVFVDNAVDSQSGTLLLKGELPNRDGRLVPGQFVDVRLVLYEDASVTVVPAPAVTQGQEGAYVYVLNPDSTVTTRPVAVQRTVDELAVLASGLKAGETVITDGQLRLSPGAKVQVRTAGASRP